VGYHNLLSKCDRALVAYLISKAAGTSDDVLHFKSAGDEPRPPFTKCFAESAMELLDHLGAYTVKASVDVHTNAAPDHDSDLEQMRLDSDDRVQAAFDALHETDDGSGGGLADAITAAAVGAGITDFTVDEVKVVAPGIQQGRGERDGEWIDTINLELICRAS
jgi:hypothetical protein